jgi:hypothetical protein
MNSLSATTNMRSNSYNANNPFSASAPRASIMSDSLRFGYEGHPLNPNFSGRASQSDSFQRAR